MPVSEPCVKCGKAFRLWKFKKRYIWIKFGVHNGHLCWQCMAEMPIIGAYKR